MKKTIITLFILILILSTLLYIATVFMFNVALKSNVSIDDEEESYAFIFKRDYLKQWVDSLHQMSALRDTFILAEDGTKLHALYVRSANDSPNTALIIHGYTDNAIRMLMIGHLYNKEMGYNILLPDLRGQGLSKADYIEMGWKDRLDIIEWIDVARGMYGDTTSIVLHGISMGAATAMMVSGEKIPANVKCVVDDCGYTSVWDEFQHELKKRYNLPAFPLLNLASMYTDYKLGWNFKEASAIDQLRKTELPMFFIHGSKDDYVPTWMVYELFDAKQGEKELWITPGVEHANSYWDFTEEYVKRTNQFVHKYIP